MTDITAITLPTRDGVRPAGAMGSIASAATLGLNIQPHYPQISGMGANLITPQIRIVDSNAGKVVLAGDVVFSVEGIDLAALQERVSHTSPDAMGRVLAEIFSPARLRGINGDHSFEEVVSGYQRAMDFLGIGKENSLTPIDARLVGTEFNNCIPIPNHADAFKNYEQVKTIFNGVKDDKITGDMLAQLDELDWKLATLKITNPQVAIPAGEHVKAI